jgi:hypothetical protein
MVAMLNPVVVEGHLLAGLERVAPWSLWRPLPSEDRIRWVFHLGATDPLPLVREKTLRHYQAHLARFLSFPFLASYCEEMEPLVLDGSVIAIGMCDSARAPLDSSAGILCEVIFRDAVRLPLALLKLDPRNANCQMIDDYWHWFWNCR